MSICPAFSPPSATSPPPIHNVCGNCAPPRLNAGTNSVSKNGTPEKCQWPPGGGMGWLPCFAATRPRIDKQEIEIRKPRASRRNGAALLLIVPMLEVHTGLNRPRGSVDSLGQHP